MGRRGVIFSRNRSSTFNGDAWLRARLLYWDNPDVEPAHTSAQYQQSVSFYLNRAIQPQYRWSWHNAQIEQDLYRSTIRRTNAHRRTPRIT